MRYINSFFLLASLILGGSCDIPEFDSKNPEWGIDCSQATDCTIDCGIQEEKKAPGLRVPDTDYYLTAPPVAANPDALTEAKSARRRRPGRR